MTTSNQPEAPESVPRSKPDAKDDLEFLPTQELQATLGASPDGLSQAKAQTLREKTSERILGTAPSDGSPIRAGIQPSNHVTAGLFRFSVTQFLVALILLLIAYPLFYQLHYGEVIVSASMTLVLISAVLAVSRDGRLMVLTILLVVPALGTEWIDQYQPNLMPAWISTITTLLFIGFVIVQFSRFILRAPRVNADVLSAGISVYLLLGLLWAAAYLLATKLTPDAFGMMHRAPGAGPIDRFDTLYFSFVTLTCLGCNDIVPVSRVARMLMMVEATTGVLYLAVMIARLVSVYCRASRNETA